jgi:hypothetical protein
MRALVVLSTVGFALLCAATAWSQEDEPATVTAKPGDLRSVERRVDDDLQDEYQDYEASKYHFSRTFAWYMYKEYKASRSSGMVSVILGGPLATGAAIGMFVLGGLISPLYVVGAVHLAIALVAFVGGGILWSNSHEKMEALEPMINDKRLLARPRVLLIADMEGVPSGLGAGWSF